MAVRFVIVGGGPAGIQAASTAARLGGEVTLIESDVISGAAHLWDCIPSKAMIATGGAMSFARRYHGMGLVETPTELDPGAVRDRVNSIEDRLEQAARMLLDSQGVRLVMGRGRLTGPNTVAVTRHEPDPLTGATEFEVEADAILVSTGSRPRLPEWAGVDGDRVLSTRDAYPPPELPERLVVIGSGVTGVEFVHMFSSLGSQVSLVVSRQQVLPDKDPEVAAALEENFIERGVQLFKGARAQDIERSDGGVVVVSTDGRRIEGSHALLAIGSIPNTEELGLAAAGVEVDDGGYVITNDHHLRTSVPHIYVAGDISGKLPLSSVATMQGRKIGEHVMGLHVREHRHLDYEKAASAIFTEPEIADVGLAEADAFAEGRKIRVTKVPFSFTAKALINNDSRGFVKILSDPATGVILGGSIVGRHAAELISVLAVAVTNGLRVVDIAESLLVHPALSEALTEAAE